MYNCKYYERYEPYIRYKNLSDILTFQKILSLYGNIDNDDCILDIGCGVGYITNWLYNFSSYVFGVDVSIECLNISNKIYPYINFIRADCFKLPFEDYSFDKVLACNIIEHVGDHDVFLQEAKRIMKKKGKIIVTTPDKDDIFKKILIHDKTHIKELNEKQVEKLMIKKFHNVKLEKGLSTIKVPALLRRALSKLIKIDIIAYGENI